MAILKIKDKDGNTIEIPALKGDPYTLTETDKEEIKEAVLAEIPDFEPSDGNESGVDKYYVTPEQYGAKGDGVTDDTDAIQQALNSGNLVISLSQKKTYKITSPLSVPKNVALYGNDATLLKEGSPTETSILHIYSDNATIKDLNLVTTLNSISADLNPPERADEEIWSNCSGISVYSATNITIDNVHMTDMQFGIKCIESSNIDISNCTINGECLYCTYLQDTTDVKYTNNSFCCTQYGSIHHHDVYIEGGCWNIYFDGCAFTGLSGVSIKCGDADPTTRNTYDIFVQNCTFDVPCPIYHGAGNSACKFTDSIIKTTGKYVFNVAGGSEIEASNFHIEADSNCSLVTANLEGTYLLSNGYAKIGKVAVISAPDGNVYVDISNCTFDCYRNDELSNIIYINRTSFGGSLSFVDNKVNLYNFGKWENSINIPNETTDVYVFGNVFRVKSDGELNHIVNNTGSETAQYINNISPDTNVFDYKSDNAKGIFIGNVVGGEPIKLSEFENDAGFVTKADIPTDESYELIGETPLTLAEKSNIKLVADAETTYEAKTPTVWNFDDVFASGSYTLKNCTIEKENDHYKIVSGATVTQHYNSLVLFYIPVEAGKTYTLGWDNSASKKEPWVSATDWGGSIAIYDGEDTSKLISSAIRFDEMNNFVVTPTTNVLNIRYFPASSNSNAPKANVIGRFNAMWLNEGNATALTEIYNINGTFNGSVTLQKVPKGTTITTEPITNVYIKAPTDKTLTESDVPADGKVTGERIEAVKNLLPLYGKTIVNFGDSIFGNAQPPVDISTHLANKTGATVYNCGFGGCRMTPHPTSWYDAFSMYRIADAITSRNFTVQDEAIASGNLAERYSAGLERLKSIDFSKVDIVTIAYGSNDFNGNGATLDNDENPLDTSTYGGALRYSIETLLSVYPNLKIFVLSIAWRFWTNESNEYVDDTNTHTNNNGKLTKDYNAKLKEVAEEYNLPFVDDYNIGIGKFNRYQYFNANDGAHHKETGRKLIAEHLAGALTIATNNSGVSMKSSSDEAYELSDEAYVHTNLPDGNKVVSYTHDGDEFGTYEWVIAGEDLTSAGTFNCSSPDNGISITPEDNGFVITGTPLLGEQSYYLVDSDNNMDFALPDEICYIYIRSFSSSNNETIASDMLYVDIEKYRADKVFIDSHRADLSEGRARITAQNSDSEAFVRIKITVKDIGVPYNHKFQIHVIAGNGEKPLNPDTTTDISYNSFVSFPYKTTVNYMAGLDYRLNRIESKLSYLPAQLDAYLVSAIGDGVIE